MHKDVMLEKFFTSYGDTKKINLKSLKMYAYVSDKLNEDLIQLFSQSKYVEVVPYITKLIRSGKIIPFVYSKSAIRELFSHIYGAIRDPFMNKNSLVHKSFYAFYTSDENKVYIAISNITNLFSYANNEFVSSIIIHELMHYSAHNINSKFYSIWGSTFHKFYTQAFMFYPIMTGTYNSELENVCKKLASKLLRITQKIEIKGDKNNFQHLLEFYRDIPKTLKKIRPKIQKDYFKFYKFMTTSSVLITNILVHALRTDMDRLINIIQEYYMFVLYNLLVSYRKLDDHNKFYDKTVFYQEYFFTSEIAAILSMGDKYMSHVSKTLKLMSTKG